MLSQYVNIGVKRARFASVLFGPDRQSAPPSTQASMDDDRAFATWALDPALAAGLAPSPVPDAELSAKMITTEAYGMPILSLEASAALASDAARHVAHGASVELLQPSPFPPSSPLATASRIASLLASQVLPLLAAKLFPAQPPLCECCRAYLLRYNATAAAPDLGRTHRIHVDNSDITLAVCLGEDRGHWKGADLCYFEPSIDGRPRSRTPDPEDSSEVVQRHEHVPGVGVLHHGEAYHFVEPLQHGERCSLVVQAMFSEPRARWKTTFLRGLATGGSALSTAEPGSEQAEANARGAPTLALSSTSAAAAAPPTTPTAPPTAPTSPPTLGELATWARLSHLVTTASVDATEPLEALAALLQTGRPALLARIKALGVQKLSERQALANELTRALREGRVPRSPGQLPIDFEAAAARLPEAAREVLLRGVDETYGTLAQQAAALVEALRSMRAAPSHPSPASADAVESNADSDRRGGGGGGSGASGATSELLRVHGALDEASCAALRQAVDARRSVAKDSVDHSAEHQLNLTLEELRALIGANAVASLLRLPQELQVALEGEERAPAEVGAGFRIECFVRRYKREERPWIQFHCDKAAFTCNVALADDALHDGGRLVCVAGGELHEIARREGEATVHRSSLLHAVSAMQCGVRYSMILFFHRITTRATAPAAAPALELA